MLKVRHLPAPSGFVPSALLGCERPVALGYQTPGETGGPCHGEAGHHAQGQRRRSSLRAL